MLLDSFINLIINLRYEEEKLWLNRGFARQKKI